MKTFKVSSGLRLFFHHVYLTLCCETSSVVPLTLVWQDKNTFFRFKCNRILSMFGQKDLFSQVWANRSPSDVTTMVIEQCVHSEILTQIPSLWWFKKFNPVLSRCCNGQTSVHVHPWWTLTASQPWASWLLQSSSFTAAFSCSNDTEVNWLSNGFWQCSTTISITVQNWLISSHHEEWCLLLLQ